VLQAGELLGAKYDERLGHDPHALEETGLRGVVQGLSVTVALLLGVLVEGEAENVATFMANGEIGEEEVAGLRGAIEKSHARDGRACQDGRGGGGGRLDAAVGHGAGMLEIDEDEEAGVVCVGDVRGLFKSRSFEDAQLHDRRRVDRASVGGG
jgi:hypothetical protein